MKELEIIQNLKGNVYTLPLNTLKFQSTEGNSTVEIEGMKAVLSVEAKKDILKIAGFDAGTYNTIRYTSGDKAAELLLGKAIKSGGQVTLAFDGPRITRVVKPGDKSKAVNKTQVIQLTEKMVAKGMQLGQVSVRPDGTGATIRLLNPQVLEHPTFKDESVSVGRAFQWDLLGGTTINDFVERMVCSNGMIRQEDGSVLHVLDPNMPPAEIIRALFTEVDPRKIAKYFEKVTELQERQLSVAEWQNFAKLFSPYMMMKEDQKVLVDHMGKDALNFEAAYHKAGFDFENLNAKQLANCPTPIKWWDALNALTWVASHDMAHKAHDWEKTKLQSTAGKWFSKSHYDANTWIQGLPQFN